MKLGPLITRADPMRNMPTPFFLPDGSLRHSIDDLPECTVSLLEKRASSCFGDDPLPSQCGIAILRASDSAIAC